MRYLFFIFFIFFLFISSKTKSQSFERIWGEIDIYKGIRVSVSDKVDNRLFFNFEMDDSGNIYIIDHISSNPKLFFSFPSPNPAPYKGFYSFSIDGLELDNSKNLIIYGRTHADNIGTTGVYSTVPFPLTIYTGYTFIAKVNSQGILLWLTYFHDLSQYKKSLAIDKYDNIYVLNKRHKSSILSNNVFQNTGDLNSIYEYQDVISKISSTGNHIWSTFYYNNNSEINGIITTNNGLFVHGEYRGQNINNTFFSTNNSFQTYPSQSHGNNNSTVFLSKFNFNGSRIWSTYFGNNSTRIPINKSSFPGAITTDGTDVYILTQHVFDNSPNPITTANAYLQFPVHIGFNQTISRFSDNGNRIWTSFLYTGNHISFTNKKLYISGEVYSNIANMYNMTSSNSHQNTPGGNEDNYLSIFDSNNNFIYGSFYGYSGNDHFIIQPTNHGYFVIGQTLANLLKNEPFSTTGKNLSGNSTGNYRGYISGYFREKNLNRTKNEIYLDYVIYPNPTEDIINIINKNQFTDNVLFTIYDMNGKKLITQVSNGLTHNQININQLNSGVYILKIENELINQSHKFIKK